MKSKKLLAGIIAILMLGAVVLAGCGGAEVETGGDSEALPDVNWTMQTTWSQGWLLHDMAEEFAERVYNMTGGKFNIDVLPAGAVVGGLEVLDATAAGTIDAYHSWPGYWMSQHPSAPFFASIPMHLEPQMHIAWFFNYGGMDLYQEMMDEIGLNVKVWPGGVTHPEVLAHSNVPIESMEDFQGLTYRAPGWWGEMLGEVGVAVTMLPGTELYPALERGVLDATEFSIPVVNMQQGFYEVTDYVAGPGMHQPTCFFEVGVNQDKYDALPDEYKAIVDNAIYAMTLDTWTRSIVEDMDALDYYKEQGKEFTYVDPDTQREIREIAWEWIDEDVKARNNDHYTRTWESVQEFWERFVEFEKFMLPVRE